MRCHYLSAAFSPNRSLSGTFWWRAFIRVYGGASISDKGFRGDEFFIFEDDLR